MKVLFILLFSMAFTQSLEEYRLNLDKWLREYKLNKLTHEEVKFLIKGMIEVEKLRVIVEENKWINRFNK